MECSFIYEAITGTPLVYCSCEFHDESIIGDACSYGYLFYELSTLEFMVV